MTSCWLWRRTSTSSPRTSGPARCARLGLGYEDVARGAPGGRLPLGVGLREPGRVAVRQLGRLRSRARGHVGHLRPQPARGPDAGGGTGGCARRHQQRAVRGHRRPRRAAPPGPHGRGAVRRHRHVRLDGGDDRRRRRTSTRWVQRKGPGVPLISDAFRAADGWFVAQVGREHQFDRLAALVGRPEWLSDPRLATRPGWREHLDEVIRPAVEAWAADKTKLEAAHAHERRGHRRRPGERRRGRDRRPAPGGAQHDRRGAPHRRRLDRTSSPGTR